METSATAWKAFWIERRNVVLASPAFQRFAARSLLTRMVARRRARTLFDLVAGFTYSQILAACIDTRLLDRLASGSLGAAELADAIDVPLESTERLLRAAAALRLVEPVGDRWALGSDGAALLGNRGIAEMVAHHRLLYADLADPVALLRRGGGGGALARLWDYQGDGWAAADYSALMTASQPLVAAQVIDAYRFDRHRRMLDIGGGEGGFLSAVGQAFPRLELGLFDRPEVGDRARDRLAGAGLTDRTTIHADNFHDDALPGGYDLMTLVRVLHDHDDAPALALLRRIRSALTPGGTLLIAEPMAGTRGAERMGDAYFGFYLLAMGAGRPRSAAEIAAMLREAGFARVKKLKTHVPLTTSVIVATT